MNATAADTDAARAFLSDQVEAAIRKLTTQEFETEELRETTRGLADELLTVATTRDQLGFQVTRLTEEKDEIFVQLQGQVRDPATLAAVASRTKLTRAPSYPTLAVVSLLFAILALPTLAVLSFANDCETGVSFPIPGSNCD